MVLQLLIEIHHSRKNEEQKDKEDFEDFIFP